MLYSTGSFTIANRESSHITWGRLTSTLPLARHASHKTGCCIFHKRREFGESSSDESDSDIDDEKREKLWSEAKARTMYHA